MALPPRVIGLAAFLGSAAYAAACGSSNDSNFNGTGWGDDGGRGDDGAGCLTGNCSGDDGGPPDPCVQAGKPSTTISGTVYDPAGHNPLYNVIVYVPGSDLKPFPKGVSCDKCGVLESGSPIVSTLTGPDGKFALKNVPPGDDVPLVMQIGKWRKKITVPHVESCATTPMDDKSVMRLPANKSEGDMPQLAMATGQADPFECLLRKIGISDSEFTNESGNGKVHVYQGAGVVTSGTKGAQLSGGSTPAQSFWANGAALLNYDIIINACEANEHQEEKPQSSIDNLVAYADKGGRVFTTHYQYFWLDPKIVSQESSPWIPTSQFVQESLPQDNGTETYTVDTSFPKGAAFGKWLTVVGASTTPGQLAVTQPRYNTTAQNPPSVRWIYGTNTQNGQPALMHYTFNTPWGASDDQQCGKVLFSDFHVVAGIDPANPPPTATFPAECNANPMSAQEAALEFMLFDLSSCIQKDTNQPQPPK